MANGNFGGGNGTESSPYILQDQADLFAIASGPVAYYKLDRDINLSSRVPSIPTFSGQIDGQGFVLNNLHPNGSAWISNLNAGIIKNLTIHNPTLTASTITTSLIANSITFSGQIYNVNLTGTYTVNVTGSVTRINLFAGATASDGSIVNCTVYCNNSLPKITANSVYIFGGASTTTGFVASVIACKNYLNVHSSSISSFSDSNCSDCINYGNFTSEPTSNQIYTAGITSSGTAIRCSNYGDITVTSTSTVYGIGVSRYPAIDCANYGNISAPYSSGICFSTATRCANYGTLYGSSAVGGITYSNSTCTDCFFAGQIQVPSLGTQAYYGNSTVGSSNNINLKVLNTSTITVRG